MLFNFIYDTGMDKTVVDLGNLNGKLLLFGGVYSNLQALETLNVDVAAPVPVRMTSALRSQRVYSALRSQSVYFSISPTSSFSRP